MNKQSSGILIFIRAVIMPFVYMLLAACINTLVASCSMEFYQKHVLLGTFFAGVLMIPACLLLMRQEGYFSGEKRERALDSFTDWMLLSVLAISVCIALNYWISMSGIMEWFGGFDKVAERIYSGNLFEEFLAVVLAAPVIEELLFRGLAYRGFERLFGQTAAMLLSALFFGLYHRNFVQGLYAFLLGLLLVWAYEAFQSVKAAIVFHMAANAASVFMTECLDMSFLEIHWGVKLLYTIGFTVSGTAAFLCLESRKKQLRGSGKDR